MGERSQEEFFERFRAPGKDVGETQSIHDFPASQGPERRLDVIDLPRRPRIPQHRELKANVYLSQVVQECDQGQTGLGEACEALLSGGRFKAVP